MRYSEAFGELAHLFFFFESMMDDDDGKGGGRNVHQIPPPVHEQLQMPNREESLVFFSLFSSLV